MEPGVGGAASRLVRPAGRPSSWLSVSPVAAKGDTLGPVI